MYTYAYTHNTHTHIHTYIHTHNTHTHTHTHTHVQERDRTHAPPGRGGSPLAHNAEGFLRVLSLREEDVASSQGDIASSKASGKEDVTHAAGRRGRARGRRSGRRVRMRDAFCVCVRAGVLETGVAVCIPPTRRELK